LNAIENFKRDRYHGEDCISNECLVDIKELLIPILEKQMLNNSLNCGFVPSSGSKAIVIHIFKQDAQG
jgi:hypothetical protein